MKRILLALLALAVLAVFTLYLVPQWLMMRDIAAARPDVALLAAEPEPQEGNGIDALWLLGYRTADDQERRQIMRDYGRQIMARQAVPQLADKALPQPQPGELNCTAKNGAACLAEVRADLPRFRAAAQQYRPLLDNVAQLGAYEVFAQRGWPNDNDDLSKFVLPPFNLLFANTAAAALDWADGRHQAALAGVCRNIKTGRTLLKSRPGLILPMIGNALIRKNTELAAAMVAEQPAQAQRLPEECAAAFEPLSAQEQSICTAMRDEFRFAANLVRKMEQNPADYLDTDVESGMPFEDGQSANPLLRRLLNAEHTQALIAAHYVYPCTPAAQSALQQDRALGWKPADDKNALAVWACANNVQGCLIAGSLSDFSDYAHRLQDTAMLQRAFQAAWFLHSRPAAERPALIEDTLRRYSTPSRRLQWNEREHSIGFQYYSEKESKHTAIPVSLK